MKRTAILLAMMSFALLSILCYFTRGTVYMRANYILSALLGLVFLILQYPLQKKPILEDLNPAALLFIVYNTIPQVLMINALPLKAGGAILIFLSVAAFVLLYRSGVNRIIFSRRERLVYGSIILLFSIMFIGRGITVISALPGSGMTEEISVSISDVVLSVFWLVSAVSLMMGKAFGTRNIRAVLLEASLLFISLLILMAAAPLTGQMTFDSSGFAVIAGMSVFFIIPSILVIKKEVLTNG